MLCNISSKKKCLILHCIFCIGLCVTTLIVRVPAVSILYTLVGLFVLESLLCNVTLSARIFSTLFFCALMILSEMVCSAVVTRLWGLNLQKSLDYGLLRAFSIVIAKLIQVAAIKLTVFTAKWKKNEIDQVELLFIFPILMCQVCSILLAYHIFELCFYIYEYFTLNSFLSMFSILYINVIIFWYFDRIKEAYMYKSKNEAMEIKFTLQEEYYRTLAVHQKDTIALWHDMRKHIDLMKALNSMDQKTTVSNYLNELEEDIRKRLKIVQTEDPVIGALLTEQLKRADRQGVSLELDTHLISQTRIQSIDLCVILGNLFDNAFTACENIPNTYKKYIKAEIKQREQLLFIELVNPVGPEKASMRQNGKHGFGLNNVRRSVNKYGGKIDINATKEEFCVRIIIP